MAKYVCKNFGECDKAGEQIEVPPGMDPLCPECKSALVPVESGGKFDFLFRPIVKRGAGATAALIAVILLGDDAMNVMKFFNTPRTPPVPYETSGRGDLHGTSASGVGSKPYPDQSVIDAEKRQSEAELKRGRTANAESASRSASAKEMIKTAIAYLDQDKLAAAEKELAAAKERDPAEPLIHYNLGVLRIKQGKTDEALTAFEESFRNGFAAFDKLDQDKDLDPLRKDKRFRDLLRKYRSASR